MNRNPLIACLILSTMMAAVVSAQPPQPRPRLVPPNPSFKSHLDEAAVWTMANGQKIRLEMDDQNTLVLDEKDQAITRISFPEYVRGAVAAPGGKVVVLMIWNSGGYAKLLRLNSTEIGITVEDLWKKDDLVITDNRWWVNKLGALSENGKILLAEIAEQGPNGGRIHYRWQTWELEPAKRIGVGLTIANGVVDEPKKK